MNVVMCLWFPHKCQISWPDEGLPACQRMCCIELVSQLVTHSILHLMYLYKIILYLHAEFILHCVTWWWKHKYMVETQIHCFLVLQNIQLYKLLTSKTGIQYSSWTVCKYEHFSLVICELTLVQHVDYKPYSLFLPLKETILIHLIPFEF
jgi:hypothetical protein